jgi:hypothetical protein
VHDGSMTTIEEQELKIWTEHRQTNPSCECSVCARLREIAADVRLVLSSRPAEELRKLLGGTGQN